MVEIDKNNLNTIKKQFFEYVHSFKNDDVEFFENILLKEKHTVQVCKEIIEIGTSLGLRQNELYMAEIIALLHDIGRFEQYKIYRTFADGKSVNHAELGLKILKKNRALDDLSKPAKSLILKAVKHHNRASLPDNETDECVFFIKLLRDADKLDIYRVVTEYYIKQQNGKQNQTIELDLPNTYKISEEVCQSLLNKEIVNFDDIKNLNDLKLLQVGWIFDINFSATYFNIKSRRYLEIIRKTLPKTEPITNIFNVIYEHLGYECSVIENYTQRI
jgi:hypothetical protein